MNQKANKRTRKLHRWTAILFAIPMLVVIASGILLQVKKQVPWIQPPTRKASASIRTPVSLDELLRVTASVPEASVDTWDDIDRIDVRPGKGLAKVQCANRWEVQIDLSNADVLSSTYRRSDLIESFHDGSFFADGTKLWVFLPNGIALFTLWITGLWLWYLPIRSRRRQYHRKRVQQARISKTASEDVTGIL